MKRSDLLCLLVACTLFTGTLDSSDHAQQIQPFQSNTRVVLVDVVVSNRGQAVHDLKQQEFSVLENGRPQTIIGFQEHGPNTPRRSKPAVSNLLPDEYTNYVGRDDPGALTVLLLDSLNSSHDDLGSARNEMLKFLKKLPPGRKVALYTLGSQLRMVQNYTDDTNTLIAAAQQLSSRSHPV